MWGGRYLLVDLDADGSLVDVPNLASPAVIELVGHPLVDRTVHLYIDVVADPVGAEVRSQGHVPLFPERPGEEIPRPRPKSVTCRHSSSTSNTTTGFSSAAGAGAAVAPRRAKREEGKRKP